MTHQEFQSLLGPKTKYSKWYLNIILKAQYKNRIRNKKDHPDYVYYEEHHILPRSIFPEYKDLKTYKWNGVLLTAREHFICHALLWKHYKNVDSVLQYKMAKAFNNMRIGKHMDRYINSYLYQIFRTNLSHPEHVRIKISISNTGKRFSPKQKSEYCEYCKKMFSPGSFKVHHGENCKQNPNQPEACKDAKRRKYEKSSKKLKGRVRSPNHCLQLSNALKQRVICEFCGKDTNITNHNRWHGKNCKLNPNRSEESKIREKNSLERHKKSCQHRRKVDKIMCEFCQQRIDPGNYKQHHGVYCKQNPNREINYSALMYCEHCKTYANPGNYKQHHGDKCKIIRSPRV